jgi:hypothetical protein
MEDLMISPPRKRRINTALSLIPYEAEQTRCDSSKSSSDSWVLVTMEHVERLDIRLED